MKTRILSIILALLLPCLLSCSSQSGKKEIYVIVKSTGSDFWHSVEDGVNAAATELNVSVTFEGPENEEDYERQNEMIRRAVENGADAIVLSAIDYEKNASAVDEAVRAGVKTVTIDSDVDSSLVEMFIGTDNYAAGEKAAAAVYEMFGTKEAIRIGIVNCYESTANVTQREEGFRAYVNALPNAEIVGTVHVNSNTQSAVIGTKTIMEQHPEINVLIGFNEWTTLGVGTVIRDEGLKDSVHGIGFDTNIVSIDMIESGEMDALVVQNSFAIGFLGVRYAESILNGEAPDTNELFTDVTVVTRENLFDDEVQKILFRFR